VGFGGLEDELVCKGVKDVLEFGEAQLYQSVVEDDAFLEVQRYLCE
jgi:hypothetical protein